MSGRVARLTGLALRSLALVLVAVVQAPARADEAEAWAALRAGGAVALMRHGDAPGVGDPLGWRLDDCKTQRNLSERGRAEARGAGARLRAERIAVARVLSSPWCRCVDTATLAGMGAVQVEPTFGNAYVMSEQRAALAEGGRALIGRWRGPGVLLVVSHGENIDAMLGARVAPAGIVVVVPVAGGASRVVGTIAPPRL